MKGVIKGQGLNEHIVLLTTKALKSRETKNEVQYPTVNSKHSHVEWSETNLAL